MEHSKIIQTARNYAVQMHGETLDDSGKPFFYHPFQVAEIIWDLTRDENLTAAAYLHDVIEDTETTYADLLLVFGEDIADLVNEVTHEGKSDSKGYYFPRLKTQRGILLKFADRMHNLSRMDSWSDKRVQCYLKKSVFWKSK